MVQKATYLDNESAASQPTHIIIPCRRSFLLIYSLSCLLVSYIISAMIILSSAEMCICIDMCIGRVRGWAHDMEFI